MKKIIALLLALVMLLALCACGKQQEETGYPTVGMLDDGFDTQKIDEHVKTNHADELFALVPAPLYPSLSAALLSLGKGEIDEIALCKTTADYVAAHNDMYVSVRSEYLNPDFKSNRFSVMTTDQNAELRDIMDAAIKQLKTDGTLDRLIGDDIMSHIAGDPTPIEMPHFDGAKTYKIAVTGDLPPMDFLTADGKAAGFNVALLTEIARIAQVNFELVPVEAGARLTALASGAVDAAFWMIAHCCPFCGEFIDGAPAGTLLTESYFEDYVSVIRLRSAK